MVHYDVVGAVRQEQIVQYIQHTSPVHITNGREGGGSDKTVGTFAPMLLYQHTIQLHA